ncbi:hypothetical protein ACH6EH_10495 [Paenibacillus sp. JSM ZJ436]|uniref:hypothetical protein n=1 Tax=Paenibacillus sp. JSM ZJ436 TaxID=3376190 RepID=UPI003796E932
MKIFIGSALIAFGLMFAAFNVNASYLWLSLIGVIWLIVVSSQENRQEQMRSQEIADRQYTIEGFKPSQQYVSKDSSISIDENSSKLLFSDESGDYIINFSDVVESEIIENESSVTKTSRGSQLGGAIVGGVLAGGAGAVIGGLSGTKSSSTTVNSIRLKVVVDDFQKPNFYIYFLNTPIGLTKDSPGLIQAQQDAHHWHSIMSVIIRRQHAIRNIT